MHLVTKAIASPTATKVEIMLKVDRHKLARRRWRGKADDATDFGFDVVDPLSHGDCIHQTDTKKYYIEQLPEPCFLIPLKEAENAAWLGWMVGNLHFKAAFSEEGILVQDDLAVEQMLQREHIHYHAVTRVFQPCKQGGHSHDHGGHSHAHDHSHD